MAHDAVRNRPPTLCLSVFLVLAVLAAAPAGADGAADAHRIDRLVEGGHQALARGKHQKALKRFEKADRLAGSDSPAVMAGLARAHLELAHYDEALAQADRLLAVAEEDRQRAKAHHLVGLAYFGRAMELETEASAPGEGSVGDAGVRRTKLYRTIGETYRAAADAFRRVVETSGGGAVAAWQSWADSLYRAGDPDRTRVVLERFAEAVGGERNLPERARALDSCAELAAEARRLVFVSEEIESPEEIRQIRSEQGIGTDTELLVTGLDGYEPPEQVHTPAPRYTDLARRQRLQGRVVINLLIDAEGKVACPRVIRGLPSGLTDSALETVLDWRFEPALHDGEPVPVFYSVSISFRLS